MWQCKFFLKLKCMREILLSVVLIIATMVCSQNVIIGKIVSDKDKHPIQSVSVYINKSSKVTLSDAQGEFAFAGVLYPLELVVSCIGYERKVVNVLKDEGKLSIEMSELFTKLDTVEVEGSEGPEGSKKHGRKRLKNLRADNFSEFKTLFLGDDKWGRAAVLKDNPVLRFWHQVDTVFRAPEKSDYVLLKYKRKLGNGYSWTADSSMVYQYSNNLYASSGSSIMLELPLLGYDVALDLEQFYSGEIDEKRKLGFSYYSCFTPRKDTLAISKADVEKNRQEVYYNSSQHFFRSLFSHRLYENGYLVAFDSNGYDWTLPEHRKYVCLDSLLVKLSENTYAITGLKGKKLRITYMSKNRYEPINLNAKRSKQGERRIPWSSWSDNLNSFLLFRSDTCLVRKDGITTDNLIVVGGKMAEKLAGAMLPTDYLPAETIGNSSH